MPLRNRIRSLSVLPARFNVLLEQALSVIRDRTEQEDLTDVACLVGNAVWERWFAQRLPDDNRQEHEWGVFDSAMKIAESERLSLSEKRVATAFSFTHDTYFIPRITEKTVREATDDERRRLLAQKREQRIRHMEGGADNANMLLRQIRRPDSTETPLLTETEIDRCLQIIRHHDLWKLDGESPPPTNDRLALVCLEADALWPLQPLGVQADLERPDALGNTRPVNDPAAWRTQLQHSLKTLTSEYRPKWTHIARQDFQDEESIFRTRCGYELYRGWRNHWGV